MTNLRKFRLAKKMKQEDLAKLAGCSKSYVALVETGRSLLSPKLAAEFGRILGVDPLLLLGEDLIRNLTDDAADFRRFAEILVTHYFDPMIQQADNVPEVDRLRFWVVYEAVCGGATAEELDLVHRTLVALHNKK